MGHHDSEEVKQHCSTAAWLHSRLGKRCCADAAPWQAMLSGSMLHLHRLAYDGKGNYVVHNEGELADGVKALGGFETGLYAEAWVPYVKVSPG